MFSLTCLIGVSIFIIIARRHDIAINKLFGLIVWGYLAGVLGSRFLYALNNISQFQSDPWRIFSISPGGFAFYGGFISTILVGGLYIKINQLSFWNIADYVSPSLAIGMSITKTGCFLGGCCYGKETTLGIGVQFPAHSIPALKYGIPHSIHPSQIYTSVLGLFILIVILWNLKRRRFAGQAFLSFVILFSLERMLNLTRRGDILGELIWGVPQSQFWGALFFIAALTAWIILSRKRNMSSDIPENLTF
jgi:phosphatidylglycerol:prolipoprotein diacylglycerol transferase